MSQSLLFALLGLAVLIIAVWQNFANRKRIHKRIHKYDDKEKETKREKISH